ncbi:mannonate dehydratase [Saonia flava]|uniref:Mannonate dehydratase n=2 Tax=Saonia flava TaxID=523696 RepID=A0A846QYF3_9FLAO|nr:mannonate dehydratase [Saonia flava]
MIQMQQSMRWYGPHDEIKLRDIRQSGVSHIVSAMHQIPVGDIWTIEEIKKRQEIIRSEGLEWSVIESLPVHEDIKRRKGDFKKYIDNYKVSLKNVAKCGLKVVTYNFMPVLDWVRTHHAHLNPNGTKALLYNRSAFMYFDLFLLKRPNVEKDYSTKDIEKAKAYGETLSNEEKETLFRSVLLGLPGSTKGFTRDEVLELLDNYKGIDEKQLRANLIAFLNEVAPIAQELGLSLAIHPDDPPFSVMGLPRIVCTYTDIKQIIESVDIPANGLCYCTGSLGANPSNDLVKIVEDFGNRIHFLHLRNVKRSSDGVFQESEHLNGDNPMEAIMEKLIVLMNTRGIDLPMRPDHGFLHDFEGEKEQFVGYSLIGRLKGLAELRGLEKGISYKLYNN